jgi:SAM-dependent methyltransferase
VTYESKMRSSDYPEGYWERGEGSNYVNYADDPGWWDITATINHFLWFEGIGPGVPLGTASIREIACAKGYFVLQAQKWGFDAQGVDISEYAIRSAPEPVQPYVQVANAVNLPWADESADVVCSWEFFEHVPEDEVSRVLDEKLRVLKPGGHLWMKIGIEVPESHPHYGTDVDHDHTHVCMRPREFWEAHFASRGLKHRKDIEDHLDDVFRDRDWVGRFFVWQRP